MSIQDHSSLSPSQLAWRKLRANQLALLGLFLILFFFVVALFGPIIRPDKTPKANQQHLELARKSPAFNLDFLLLPSPNVSDRGLIKGWLYGFPQNFREIPVYQYELERAQILIEKYTGNTPNNGEKLTFPKGTWTAKGYAFSEDQIIQGKTFWLGTDRYGRDMLSRLMAGTWISFTVGFIAILISLFIGITLGLLAAYYKGWLDELIMWFINVVWSIPTLLLVIAITLALGKGFWQVFVAVGLTMWVEVARVVRGQVMSVREMEYVEAGRSLGFRDFRIMWKHILPNVTGPIIVISASNFAAAILIEAGLSFLGLGAQPPQATWGKMISEHKGYIITGDAYLAIFPGIAICLLVLSFVLLGNGLRDAFDTKSVKGVNL